MTCSNGTVYDIGYCYNRGGAFVCPSAQFDGSLILTITGISPNPLLPYYALLQAGSKWAYKFFLLGWRQLQVLLSGSEGLVQAQLGSRQTTWPIASEASEVLVLAVRGDIGYSVVALRHSVLCNAVTYDTTAAAETTPIVTTTIKQPLLGGDSSSSPSDSSSSAPVRFFDRWLLLQARPSRCSVRFLRPPARLQASSSRWLPSGSSTAAPSGFGLPLAAVRFFDPLLLQLVYRCSVRSSTAALQARLPLLRPVLRPLLLQARLPLLRRRFFDRCLLRLVYRCSPSGFFEPLLLQASGSSTRCSVPVLSTAASFRLVYWLLRPVLRPAALRLVYCCSVRFFDRRSFRLVHCTDLRRFFDRCSVRFIRTAAPSGSSTAAPSGFFDRCCSSGSSTAAPSDSSTAAPSDSSTAAPSDLVHRRSFWLVDRRFFWLVPPTLLLARPPPLLLTRPRRAFLLSDPPLLSSTAAPSDSSTAWLRPTAAHPTLLRHHRPLLRLSRRPADPSESSTADPSESSTADPSESFDPADLPSESSTADPSEFVDR
uniref:Uncharacterized protein n=1 Tax=Macrostomum lignano TaxID=282301 RepID=A0A1I8FJE6_9PLAT